MIHVQICHQVVLTGLVEIWQFQPICFHIFGGPGSTLNPLVVSKHPFLYSDSDDCATCSNQSLHISKTLQIKHVQHLELLQLSDSAPSYALLSKYANHAQDLTFLDIAFQFALADFVQSQTISWLHIYSQAPGFDRLPLSSMHPSPNRDSEPFAIDAGTARLFDP